MQKGNVQDLAGNIKVFFYDFAFFYFHSPLQNSLDDKFFIIFIIILLLESFSHKL